MCQKTKKWHFFENIERNTEGFERFLVAPVFRSVLLVFLNFSTSSAVAPIFPHFNADHSNHLKFSRIQSNLDGSG